VEIEPKHQYQHELGLDLSSLVDRFFLKAANNAFQRDYILTYKKHREKNTFRFRAGGDGSFSYKHPAPFSERNRKSESLNARFATGLEKYYAFSDRFKMNYGAELLYHFRYSLTTFDNELGEYPEKTTNSHDFGVQLIVGFQFALKPRLIISSESGYRLRGQLAKSNYSFINENNDRSEKSWIGSGFFIPSSGIFLSFLF
jgi:hypothetical protein